jgi:hypothetical protein
MQLHIICIFTYLLSIAHKNDEQENNAKITNSEKWSKAKQGLQTKQAQ